MRRLKSGDIYAISLYPYFERYVYAEYIVVKGIPRGDHGSEVMVIYNYFTKAMITDITSIDLKEVFIGPLVVNLPNGEIENFTYLGNRKQPTKIERLPYFKSCEIKFEFTDPEFVPDEWWLIDFHISATGLDFDLYPKEVNYDILEYADRISPRFIRWTILLEYSKYNKIPLPVNLEEDISYLVRKSKYFPPRNFKVLKEVIDQNSQNKVARPASKNTNIDSPSNKMILNRKKIDLFWTWFLGFEASLREINEKNQEKFFSQMMSKYDKIGSETIFEIKESDIGKHKLVISADGIRENFDEVEEIVNLAPKCKYFDIIAFRQPDPDFRQFSYEDSYTYDITNFYFKIVSEKGAPFDIEVFIGDIDDLSEDAIEVAFMFIDAQIGEYKSATLLNEIEFSKLDCIFSHH